MTARDRSSQSTVVTAMPGGAAGVGCIAARPPGGARPGRLFDVPIGISATEKSRRLIVAVVTGRLSAIATAFCIDSLSKSDIADVAEQTGQHARYRSRKARSINQRLPCRGDAPSGRTSTTPPSLAAGQRAAISSTGSRLSASKR